MNNGYRKAARIAAFFDLDGTLIEKPSLERRFFRVLRERNRIPLRNFLLWFCEALRLAPRGWQQMLKGNKAYLRDVRIDALANFQKSADESVFVPFFPEAIGRAAWHARQGHKIILITGTLEPLALRAVMKLKDALRERGCETAVHVCATRLERKGERWSGRIQGEAIFGEAKARAMQLLAKNVQLDLAQSYAHGDSASDRWMLESVGYPQTVNPSKTLRRIARKRGWPIASWTHAAEKRSHSDHPTEKLFSPQEAMGCAVREVAR